MSDENEAVGAIRRTGRHAAGKHGQSQRPRRKVEDLDRKNAVRLGDFPLSPAYHEPARRGNSGHCVAVLAAFVRKRVGKSFPICTYI